MSYLAYKWSELFRPGEKFRSASNPARVYVKDDFHGTERCLNKAPSKKDRHRAEVKLRKMTKAQRKAWEQSFEVQAA